MAEDKGQQQFRTLGDRHRARRRLRGITHVMRLYEADRRYILTDDAFTNADDFLEGDNDLARHH